MSDVLNLGETGWVIVGLALGTIIIRLAGVLLGQRIPSHGAWARAIKALPGCLIVSLVAVSVLTGSIQEWSAALVAVVAAALTRNLPLTMAAGILSIWLLRHMA